jgi:hypothetical protein
MCRTKLLVPFSYSILMEQKSEATIRDLAHSVWNGMLKAIENN